ncbi:MAG: hypothetical protein GC179_18375 [Anaerolineaceae bacterium]|nr:hypothetical protein [Anaerolineaceae bacterium]
MRRSIVSIMLLVVLLLASGIIVVAQDDPAQANKQKYLAAVAEYNGGNREAFYTLLTNPFMMNQGEPSLAETTRDDVRGYDGALVAAMPDLKQNADVVIAQGDWVAVHVTYIGTFTEPLSFPPFGPDPIPATNKVVTWTEMDYLHFNADGLVNEVWALGDPSVLFGQLGVFPSEGNNADGTLLNAPAGYQALGADELAATFTSGKETRNTTSLTDQFAAGLSGFNANMTDPFIGWQGGLPFSITQTQRDENVPFFAMLQQAMPDINIQVNQVIAEGDWVAALTIINGTFTQDINFGQPLTHTDQPLNALMGLLYRYNADGQIVETWSEGDLSPILQGLGVIPSIGV